MRIAIAPWVLGAYMLGESGRPVAKPEERQRLGGRETSRARLCAIQLVLAEVVSSLAGGRTSARTIHAREAGRGGFTLKGAS